MTYRIGLADDESIVLDSLSHIISTTYGERCALRETKTGRGLIELCAEWQPDICFVDISMPQLNGLKAMEEIHQRYPDIYFIILSAYDSFEYARKALSLGSLEYLTKPFRKEDITSALDRAISRVERERERRRERLAIAEKLELAEPVIESGLLYSLLYSDDFFSDHEIYRRFLGFEEDYGQIVVVEWGDEQLPDGRLTNPVGSSVRGEKIYTAMRTILRDSLRCAVGPLMGNRVLCYLPSEEAQQNLGERVILLQKLQQLQERLSRDFDCLFRLAAGHVAATDQLPESLHSAQEALKLDSALVTHADDLPLQVSYPEDYPIDTERHLFEQVRSGDVGGAAESAETFYRWMVSTYPDAEADVRLKCLEFVLEAERQAYLTGGRTYHFLSRSDYLTAVLQAALPDELGSWFTGKVSAAARQSGSAREHSQSDLVGKIQNYIDLHYAENVTLDSCCQLVNLSPYYASRLFKEKTGENFIDYLTRVRMEHARSLLRETAQPIKEVAAATGYSDPNYFSRLFRKVTGSAPTDYRSGSSEVSS